MLCSVHHHCRIETLLLSADHQLISACIETTFIQVHIRVASPPIRFPCYMGINIPTKEELIANRPEFRDLANYIGKCYFLFFPLVRVVDCIL